jgi:uncharacterized protein YdaU (DUF1376 family)
MKDPAFLFYPNDYIGGTMGMTFEQKGAYMELLMAQFNRGHMTSHMIGHVLGQRSGQLWDVLKDKFVQDESGRYYNPRLEEEQAKRKQFTISRKNNRKGNNQYTDPNHLEGHMTSHMTSQVENGDENIIILSKNVSINILTLIREQELSDEYILVLKNWFAYKTARKEKYKSQQAVETLIKRLGELSERKPATAMKIIEQSICNNWAGLFALEKPRNGRSANDILPGDSRYCPTEFDPNEKF